MSAVNPYTPPRAQVSDVQSETTEFSQPKVWSASGRIGRVRYLAYMMVGYLALVVAIAVVAGLGVASNSPALIGVAAVVGLIPYGVLSVLCAIQRAHDMDWTGWSIFLLLIPFLSLIWLIKGGTPGENRFGPPPPPNGTGVVIGAWAAAIIPVIGILAAIALPAYQQYTVRAKAMQTQLQQQPQATPPSQQ